MKTSILSGAAMAATAASLFADGMATATAADAAPKMRPLHGRQFLQGPACL